jgi:septum site-determining protein MinC
MLQDRQGKSTPKSEPASEPAPEAPVGKQQIGSLVLQDPVRSGQSIVFKEGDVTVLGSVGSGAEIVAGGSIHIYGTLRGRAMAGVAGNSEARIFCNKIEAELLAIDGYYRTAEDINASLRNRPVQAWLDGSTMMITALN